MRFLFFLSFILLLPAFPGNCREVIQLKTDTEEVYVVRNFVEYYVDTSNSKTAMQMSVLDDYKRVPGYVDDLLNENKSHTYWIRFSVVNTAPESLYRLEMFDHDIDEVSLFCFHKDSIQELHSGYSSRFSNRDLFHKNIGFMLSLRANDTITYLMRFRSHKKNILEPVIRSVAVFYHYSIIEYTLLGFFYGFTCVIIIYNLIYFVILRKIQCLYYLIYMSAITIYLMSGNGTGFQFLWPDSPEVNYWIGNVSSAIGISALLVFTNSYLNLENSNKVSSILLVLLSVLNICNIPILLIYGSDVIQQIIITLLVQVAFVISIQRYRSSNADKWFLIGFVILDIGFVISWLEHIHLLSSSVFTVYILYFSINLQFIAITISILQSIRQLDNEKNKALIELLETSDKNEMMRILSLKKQMNPHFIFNSLNSILQRIISGNKDEASEHLVRFSKLIRKTMEQSEVLYSRLSDEIELLQLYLSLESMRLGKTFNYLIEIAPEVDMEKIEIPGFILQPFVENSIWHGLMPKDGPKNIWIQIDKKDEVLLISIEDDGIGRKRASDNKKMHESKSHGIHLITERLQLLNKKYQSQSEVKIIDLYNTDDSPKGTKVVLTISYKYEQFYQNHYHR